MKRRSCTIVRGVEIMHRNGIVPHPAHLMPSLLIGEEVLGRILLGAGLVFGVVSVAPAQSLGTIEVALIGRVAAFHSSMQVDVAPTIGAQLTTYIARPFAFEVDGSIGQTSVDRPGPSESVSFRPVSARFVWMPYPWFETRLLVGLGYTHYFFSGAAVPGADAGGPTVTGGIQRDFRRTRVRLDVDLIGFQGRRAGTPTDLPSQLGGAVRASVALRAQRPCCS